MHFSTCGARFFPRSARKSMYPRGSVPMRHKPSSTFFSRAILIFVILGLALSTMGQGIGVAAQSGDVGIDGSPTSLEDPSSETVLPDEQAIEPDTDDLAEPVVSLVAPIAITVDSSSLGSPNDP